MTIREFVSDIFNSSFPMDKYTLKDAATDLRNWKADEFDIPKGLTIRVLYEEMNRQIREYKELNEN